MLTRQMLEVRENEYLALYAMRSSQSRGRAYPEEEHPYRTAYQRDRDRIGEAAHRSASWPAGSTRSVRDWPGTRDR